jgi:hypothetical protein
VSDHALAGIQEHGNPDQRPRSGHRLAAAGSRRGGARHKQPAAGGDQQSYNQIAKTNEKVF